MARSEDNYRYNEQHHPWWHTPEDVISWYEQNSRPLHKDALRALLEPLAGTSFLPMALSTLREQFRLQREKGEKKPFLITPHVLYLAFFKQVLGEDKDATVSGSAREAAEIALWSHLSYNVAVPTINTDKRLSPGELAFWQIRHDNVWHDPAHTQEAFSHAIGEWRLYKDGFQVGTIPMQSVYYVKKPDIFSQATLIPEASPSLEYFHDYRRPGIAALPPELQAYTSHTRLLFISEQFDFHLALRKGKPQEERGRR